MEVSEESLMRLQLDENLPSLEKWLNDETINAFLLILRNSNTAWGDVLLLSSLYFRKFADEGHSGVSNWLKKWLKKNKCPKYTRVVAPVSVGENHWIALAVDFGGRTVRSMDSLGGDGSAQREIMLKWVEHEWNSNSRWEGEFVEKDWDSQAAESPTQTNVHDCGVFACMNIRCWVDGERPMFCQDMRRMRREMACSIAHGRLEHVSD